MRSLTAAQNTLLASGRAQRRLFIRFDVVPTSGPGAGTPTIAAFWDDILPVTVAGQIYQPIGQIPQIGSVQQVGDLSVPGLGITVPGIQGAIWDTIFGEYEWHQRRAEIDIGLYDPGSMTVVGPLIAWFRGFLDTVSHQEGATGEPATLALNLESAARELTRANPRYRTDADQRERDNDDEFYIHVARVGELELEWGKEAKRGGGRGGFHQKMARREKEQRG